MSSNELTIATVVLGQSAEMRRLLAAQYRSIQRNAPRARYVIKRERLPDFTTGYPAHCSINTAKLLMWRNVVHENEGNLLLLDVDTLVLKDPMPAFAHEFDVGYTVRGGPHRINSGVIFVRCNEASRAFFDSWVTFNDLIFEHQPLCLAEVCEFGGLNQAAISRLLDGQPICDTAEFDGHVWNATQECWHEVNGETVILHVKSELRGLALGTTPETPENLLVPYVAVLAGAPPTSTINPALAKWRMYDPQEAACR